MREIYGDACNDRLLELIKPTLSFDKDKDLETQKKALAEKFRELLCLDVIEANAAPDNAPEIEEVVDMGDYTQIRFVFESELESFVPCYLLLPKGKERAPLVLTIQGHSTGFHNSIGKPIYEGDEEYITTRGDFAVQAVREGYAALAVEQRGMGERAPKLKNRIRGCRFVSTRALLLGKTVLGERIFDISRSIDAVMKLPGWSDMIDTSCIACTGNSGGGTATYYAACYDERIKLAVPDCSVCSYKASIASILHCECNCIPHALQYFEMGDLAALIAPRKLAVVAGVDDPIFPYEGVKDAFNVISTVYEKAGCPENARLIPTPVAHYWCKEAVWNEIKERLGK